MQPISKQARTTGLGESSQPQPKVPQQSSPPSGIASSIIDIESSDSTIRRPLFPYAPIEGNTDYSSKEFHDENFYDISAFANMSELPDSMGLIHYYSLKPFMTPR